MAGVAARCEADLCMQLSFIVCGRYTDHLDIICASGSQKKRFKIIEKVKVRAKFLVAIYFIFMGTTH